MERDAIQAGFGSPPNSTRAKRLGMRELFDIDALALELQQTCITETSKYVRERRPVVKSFVQAYAEGLHWFVNDRDFSIRVIQKYMRVNEKDLLDNAYDFYAPRVQKIPYPTLKGIKFILDAWPRRSPGPGMWRRKALSIFCCFRNWTKADFLNSSGKIKI